MKVEKEQACKIGRKIGHDVIGCSPLSSGAHNINVKLETPETPLVLRIAPQSRIHALKNEFEFLQMLSGTYGPKVFAFDDSHDVVANDFLVEEFLEGTHPSDFSEESLSQLAVFFNNLHQEIECRPTDAFSGNKYSLVRFFANWAQNTYTEHRGCLYGSEGERFDKLFEAVDQVALAHDSVFADRECFSVVHLDPNPNNIIITSEGIKLVDWEFVRFEAPEWDIVAVFWALELSDAQRETFLSAYGYQGSQDVLDLCMLIYICGILSWRVERISLIQNNALPEGVTHKSVDALKADFEWIVPKIEALLKLLNKL